MKKALRKELCPDLDTVRKLYPIVKKKIENFTKYWDEYPEKAEERHKEVEADIQQLSHKDMSQFNLWEYWEEDGIEHLTYRIVLPKAKKVQNITKDELHQIVSKIMVFSPPTEEEENDEIKMLSFANSRDFYIELLHLNCKNYARKYFEGHRDAQGNYFEYSVEEIVEQLYNT